MAAATGPIPAAEEALVAAVAALPSTKDGWEIPAAILKHAGLEDDVPRAKAYVLAFAQWAKSAVNSLPDMTSVSFEATDFNDYYKVVMSRIQYMYACAEDSTAQFPQCCFQSQIRRPPAFMKGGHMTTLRVFESAASSAGVGCFADVEVQYRRELRVVGERRFRATTLRTLLSCAAPGPFEQIEARLSEVTEGWIAQLDGRSLFTLLDAGESFSPGDDVQVRIEEQDGRAVVLAQGPWFRVTFVETAMLQHMATFMTQAVCTQGDASWDVWCREALLALALTVTRVQEEVHAPRRGAVAFFSGRRAPHVGFHLLQHLYMRHLHEEWRTASLVAARLLTGVRLVGTWAHEGPMAMHALRGDDLDARLPISSLFWMLLFWAATGVHTVLTDAYGSATFKYMLRDLGLLSSVGTVRQDSGQIARFAAIFPDCAKMASEVEDFGDIEEALGCGFGSFGAGGFFGEKRLTCKEFSIVAKITKATGANGVSGYAGKLGDFFDGSWASFDPSAHTAKAKAKFIVNAEADKEAMFERMLSFTVVGDAMHDAVAAGAAPSPITTQDDGVRLARALAQLADTPRFADAYPRTAQRLRDFAAGVSAAAATLPTQTQAQP